MFQIAAIFSNHMVLQREKDISIWGIGTTGEVITVSLRDTIVIASVIEGKWFTTLPPMAAGGPYTITFSSEGTFSCEGQIIQFVDVMIGEVWMAGGQSNMEFELQNSKDGSSVLEYIKDSKIRFYNTLRASYIDDSFFEEEAKTFWQICTKETSATCSAVGYYFAEKLSRSLDVTVGIISCNWGGTSASAWISKDSLAIDPDTNTYNEEYEEACTGRSYGEYLKELDEYNIWYKQWQKKVAECYNEDPNMLWSKVLQIAGENLWPEPLGPHSPFRAGGLYETMLQRIRLYSLRGFIYYQGESDDHKPYIYGKLLKKLIEEWRRDWQEELPFIFVQLPMFIGREDEDSKNWAVIREQQMNVFQTVPSTGMAVILDCGEFDNIHPIDKAPVGIRLAKQALYHVHHWDLEPFGPIYKSASYLDDVIMLTFDHIEGGFVIKGEKTVGFEIAAADKVFLPADIKIVGEKIMVSSNNLKKPQYVRYAWTNFGPVTLYNQAGLPLTTFRTYHEVSNGPGATIKTGEKIKLQ